MSGLLRRIKRSRPADAGEPLPEGQAAAPEGAPTTAEPPVFGPAPPPVYGPAPPPAQPAAEEPPVLLADPSVPAGVDPAAAPMRPPAGRRGRLRRRLRYLRRARELMLRDLGGLLYEIHRTGDGNVEAHATVVKAKVQRITGLDAEAHAIETALVAPRPETVLFQPGIGGTCLQCGELYGSDARFCASCGTPIDAAAPVVAAEPAAGEPVVAEESAVAPRRRFWQRRKVPPMPVSAEEAGEKADGSSSEATAVLAPAEGAAAAEAAPAADAPTQAGPAPAEEAPAAPPADEPPTADEPPAAQEPPAEPQPPGEPPAAEEPAAEEPPAGQPAPAADGEDPHRPFTGMGNGRADDHNPPDLSPGDPLVTRRTGT